MVVNAGSHPPELAESIAAFEQPQVPNVVVGNFLMLDIAGYEGPLDVLLDLTRRQKIDILKISILQLADQYLAYISAMRRIHLELAADYLVMAAWLAYLKSRLLLPPEEQPEEPDQPTPEELAERLRRQLLRLDAMRDAAARLFARPRLGQQTFARGLPDGIRVIRETNYSATLFELLSAYAEHKRRSQTEVTVRVRDSRLFSVEQAIDRLTKSLGRMPDWTSLSLFLPAHLNSPVHQKEALATTFVASLEMAREGHIQIRQGSTFGPIYLRAAPRALAEDVQTHEENSKP